MKPDFMRPKPAWQAVTGGQEREGTASPAADLSCHMPDLTRINKIPNLTQSRKRPTTFFRPALRVSDTFGERRGVASGTPKQLMKNNGSLAK
jgi:hypothetical protein